MLRFWSNFSIKFGSIHRYIVNLQFRSDFADQILISLCSGLDVEILIRFTWSKFEQICVKWKCYDPEKFSPSNSDQFRYRLRCWDSDQIFWSNSDQVLARLVCYDFGSGEFDQILIRNGVGYFDQTVLTASWSKPDPWSVKSELISTRVCLTTMDFFVIFFSTDFRSLDHKRLNWDIILFFRMNVYAFRETYW